jgi:hypothetical protein
MSTKQFRAPRNTSPPLDFEITYEQLIDDEWIEQTSKFKARPRLPGHQLMKITTAMQAGIAVQSAEMIGMLQGAIATEYHEEFMKLIDDPDIAIPIETLADILIWLAEEYTGRPTQLA